METFRQRVRQHGDAVGWLAGRRAWSAVRTAAVLDSDSVMRRTMRDVQARPAPGEPPAPTDWSRVEAACGAEIERLRAKLWSEDPEVAARGASLLLELAEPNTVDEALLMAFGGAAAPTIQRTQVEQAWESYRHDRYRALN